jgi:outer membrane protein OmpA-like peptidoglycan-associated protein
MRRAEAVMKELASLGVDPARMSAASQGESKPLVGQETNWARAVNRRVEFQVKGK